MQIALTFETAFYEVHLVALGLDSCILCTALYEAGGRGNWLVGWLWQISFFLEFFIGPQNACFLHPPKQIHEKLTITGGE